MDERRGEIAAQPKPHAWAHWSCARFAWFPSCLLLEYSFLNPYKVFKSNQLLNPVTNYNKAILFFSIASGFKHTLIWKQIHT